MKPIAPLAAASVALTLTLAACAPAAPADAGKTPDTRPIATVSPTPSAAAAARKSVRGNLIKSVGELAGTTNLATGATTSRFAVTDIVPNMTCSGQFAQAPVNGHFLGIHLNVETTPELADAPVPWLAFTAYDWQVYGPDGKRLNDPVGHAWTCLDSTQQLPGQIGPGQSVSGWIVLDVASATGTIVMTMLGSSTGWEWSY